MRKITTSYCDGFGGCNIKVKKEKEIRNCITDFPELSNQCNIKTCANGKCVVNPWEFKNLDCNDLDTGKKGKCVVKRKIWYDKSTDYIGVHGECLSDAYYLFRVYFYLDTKITVEEFHRLKFKKDKEVKRVMRRLHELGIDESNSELSMSNENVLIIPLSMRLEEMTDIQEYFDEIGKNEIEMITSYSSPPIRIR